MYLNRAIPTVYRTHRCVFYFPRCVHTAVSSVSLVSALEPLTRTISLGGRRLPATYVRALYDVLDAAYRHHHAHSAMQHTLHRSVGGSVACW